MLNMHCGGADDCNLNVFKNNYYMKVYSDGAATITFPSAKDGNIIVASLHRRWGFQNGMHVENSVMVILPAFVETADRQ